MIRTAYSIDISGFGTITAEDELDNGGVYLTVKNTSGEVKLEWSLNAEEADELTRVLHKLSGRGNLDD